MLRDISFPLACVLVALIIIFGLAIGITTTYMAISAIESFFVYLVLLF